MATNEKPQNDASTNGEPLHPDEAAVLAGMSEGEPEPEPDDEPEPEPEPTPPPPMTEKQIDAVFKRLDKTAASYMQAAGNVLEGHDVGLSPCPLCSYPGLVFAYGGDASDDVIKRQLTEAYFGQTPAEWPAAEGWVECSTCNGFGKLARPTKVEGNRELLCPTCSGLGCREQAAMDAQNTVLQFPQPTTTTSGATLALDGQPDSWQRPPGHPHYGLHPAAVGLVS